MQTAVILEAKDIETIIDKVLARAVPQILEGLKQKKEDKAGSAALNPWLDTKAAAKDFGCSASYLIEHRDDENFPYEWIKPSGGTVRYRRVSI